MKIRRTSNFQHRTSNIECGSQTTAHSFGVRSRIAGFNVQCSRRNLQPLAFSIQPSQRGVALIITLILLSVVTFMAITFLALSRRERSAVSTVTDTAGARLAADAALAYAEGQIMANALSTTNPFNFSLLVSTNGWPLTFTNLPNDFTNLYVSPRTPVFIPNPTNSSLPSDFRFYLDLNRNGRFDTNGWVEEFDNNNNDLGTKSFQVGDPEWIGVLERPDAPYGLNNKFIARYAFIAVPVGNALDLNAIHNQSHRGLPSLPGDPTVNPPGGVSGSTDDIFIRNEGIGSWEINLAAFLTDLNTNQWDSPTLWNPANGPYQYNEGVSGSFNQGFAFNDARALLTYRYNNNFNTLSLMPNLFIPAAVTAFTSDNIDGFTYGFPVIMTGFQLPGERDLTLIGNKVPWVGADNMNHFFTHQELFDSTKIQNPYASPILGFTDRLLNAGTNRWGGTTVSTYDRYTFYRLLSQLGTDSTPESGKMNLNYDNLDPYTNGIASSSNFMAWTPIAFFTTAADRLLRAYTTQWRNSNPTNFATTFYSVTNFNFAQTNWDNYPAFGIGNIPVLVSNRFVYSPAVNRLLQLAANIYDATTNNFGVNGNNHNYPSVFRPTFWVTNVNGYRNVYINGYVDVSQYSSQFLLTIGNPPLDTPVDVTSPSLVPNALVNASYGNVYGVPWIIGAKKGFPNFNEFSMESIVWIERKLEITRPSIDAPLSDYHTNQMYFLAISNVLGVECWNSYNSNYTSSSQIQIVARDRLSMMLTNEEASGPMMSPVTWNNLMVNTVSLSTWPGSPTWTPQQNGPSSPNANSFDRPLSASVILPLSGNAALTTNGISIYVYDTHSFIPAEDPDSTTNYVDIGIVPMPQFGLLTTNRLQVFMLDGNHVIDYVQFAGPDSSRNLNEEIADYDPSNPDIGLWNTNFFGASSTPYGVVNQIYYALNPQQNKKYLTANDDTTWRNPPGGGTVGQEIASLNAFLNANHWGSGTDPNTGNTYSTSNSNPSVQVTFAPPRIAYQYTSWQANDPLVHYVASDLNYTGAEASGLQTGTHQVNYATTNLPANNLGQLNDRYQPWGNTLSPASADTNAFNLAYKDPLVRMSDNWDFPTNKLPGVGWLGRVHRGTPWQTVYLKAFDILGEIQGGNYVGTNTWVQWTGDTQLAYGQYFDADNSAPVQDRLLFDLFTTAFNDNATRGTLSVNQNHLAAWSALFSGVVAITNNAPDNLRMRQLAQYQYPPPSNSWMIIQPAGPAWTNSALGQLVNGINQTRANANLFPLQAFAHAGDILATPQFTERSPFLNWNDAVQQQNGISDEMYEWLPQQTMSLLRCAGSPRYVIYCYGQTLKPAPKGSYTGSDQFFGMITNYQVVSEIATRAVVRFGSSLTNVVTFTTTNIAGILYNNWYSVPVVTNNNAVIESFNILPPD